MADPQRFYGYDWNFVAGIILVRGSLANTVGKVYFCAVVHSHFFLEAYFPGLVDHVGIFVTILLQDYYQRRAYCKT